MLVSRLSPKAANALVYLAFSGGEIQGARLGKKFRDELVAARLVKIGKDGNRLIIHLLDAGWDAVGEGFPTLGQARAARASKNVEGKRTAPKARTPEPTKLTESETLNAVLSSLRAYMEANELPLVNLFADRSPHGDERRVLRAYLSLARHWNEEVRLAALRRQLSGMSREQLDATLKGLRSQGRLTPYPIENARELRAEDDDAALLLGVTRHHYVRIKECST